MRVEPFFSGGLSATAHPLGCAATVREWIGRARNAATHARGPRTLVVGCSGGLGLATRVAACFGADAASVGVALERPGSARRAGTAGWYRAVAFEQAAQSAGVPSATVVGDAFAEQTKARALDAVADVTGPLDLLLYSVATPRRRDPRTGTVHTSVIKAVGEPVRSKGFDLGSGRVACLRMDPASEAEIAHTVAVMGGEDLRWWVQRLDRAGLLAPGFRCLALSYVGVPRLGPVYRGGTIGRAKDDLERHVREMGAELARRGGSAAVVAIRALVTQASLAMPLTLLYTMLLEQVLADYGIADDVLDQGTRIAGSTGTGARVDDAGRVRFDELEQRPDVQAEVWRRWERADSAALHASGAVARLLRQRARLFGFDVDGVDYAAEVDPCASSDRITVV